MSNWKEVLKAQHGELEKLEAMDRELEQALNVSDIDRILKKPAMPRVSSIKDSGRPLIENYILQAQNSDFFFSFSFDRNL